MTKFLIENLQGDEGNKAVNRSKEELKVKGSTQECIEDPFEKANAKARKQNPSNSYLNTRDKLKDLITKPEDPFEKANASSRKYQENQYYNTRDQLMDLISKPQENRSLSKNNKKIFSTIDNFHNRLDSFLNSTLQKAIPKKNKSTVVNEKVKKITSQLQPAARTKDNFNTRTSGKSGYWVNDCVSFNNQAKNKTPRKNFQAYRIFESPKSSNKNI